MAMMDGGLESGRSLLEKTVLIQQRKLQQLQEEREQDKNTVAMLKLAVFEGSTKARELVDEVSRDALAVAAEEVGRERAKLVGMCDRLGRALQEERDRNEQLKHIVERVAELVPQEGALSADQRSLAAGKTGGAPLSVESLGKGSLQLSALRAAFPTEDEHGFIVAEKAIEALLTIARVIDQSGVRRGRA